MHIDLLNNLAITAALLFVAGKFFRNRPLTLTSSLKTRLFAGLGSGILGSLLMISTIEITNTVIVDLRHLAIVVAAMFGGPVSSLLSGFIIGIMRVLLYGINTASIIAGLIAIVMGGIFGIISTRKISNVYKYLLMNSVYVAASSIVIYMLVNNPSISRNILLYYIPITFVGGSFTYYMAEYIKRSNEDHRSMMYYKMMADNSTDLISTHNLDGTFKYLSPSCKSILGYKVNELIGKSPYDFYHPEDLNQIIETHQTVKSSPENYVVEYRFKRKDGTYIWLETTSRKMKNVANSSEDIICISRNISERKVIEETLKESEERFRLLAEYSSDMITLHDVEGNYLYTSPACKIILQYEEEEMAGQDAYLFIHPDDRDIIKKHHQTLLETGYTTSTYRMRRKDGEYIWFESSINVLRESNLEDHKLIVVSRNINERKLTEQKLEEANEILKRLSTIDGLTGVKNRRSFDEYFEVEWNRAIRNSKPISLIMMDIDHFKAYNDTYGHQAGDGCLKEVAKAIQESLGRSGDSVFRYGGEEFSVILPETDEEGANFVAEKIRVAIETLNISHSGSKVSNHITLSLGTATIVPSIYSNTNDLIEDADKALYQAKQDGRNRVRTYKRKGHFQTKTYV